VRRGATEHFQGLHSGCARNIKDVRESGEGRALAITGGGAHMKTTASVRLTEEGVKSILEAALEKARSMNVIVSIAIVDDGGHLLAFMRKDGARLHTAPVAIAKARSAALTRSPTGKRTASGRDIDDHQALALTLAAGPGSYVTFPGGVPIAVNGQCVGAVGVSGAKSEEDREIAEAGIAAL
jgi:glc operon protein GlcG